MGLQTLRGGRRPSPSRALRLGRSPEREPRLHVVLADDWEVRGDGSGDVRTIQFQTMRRLRRVYEQNGLRGSFNVEVMQQLAQLRLAGQNAELRALSEEWEQLVKETYAGGHDVQLHVHPQWSDATYEDGEWRLRGSWSILDYSAIDIRQMLESGKRYLEDLLRSLNPEYRCVSFRSGSWCIAPHDHVLRVLSDLGIRFDMSIVEGIFYATPHLRLDYRQIEESFLPFYPVMKDARRVATTPQPIVCVPTHSFDASLTGLGLRAVARVVQRRVPAVRRLTRSFVAPSDTAIPDAGYNRREYFRREWAGADSGISKKRISDLSVLSFFQMREMLRKIRLRAKLSGYAITPIVLENHSKDVGDFEPLELFARYLASASEIEVITLSDLAQNLEAGMYPVRLASAEK